MKANELRIGNLVYDTKGEVNIINLEAMTYICKESLNQVKPIPLTEEWLKRFGFEYSGVTRLTKDPITLIAFDKGSYLFLANQRHVNIFYVHQLQNLYFALTGSEL